MPATMRSRRAGISADTDVVRPAIGAGSLRTALVRTAWTQHSRWQIGRTTELTSADENGFDSRGRHFDQDHRVSCAPVSAIQAQLSRSRRDDGRTRALPWRIRRSCAGSSAMCRSSRSAGTALLAQPGGPGASMRPTSKSEAAGRIFTALSTKRETLSISCFAPSGRRRRQGVLPTGAPTPGPIATQDHARRLSGVASRSGRGSQRTSRGKSACKIRSSKYVVNLIEQDHRSIMLRLGPMLGLQAFSKSRDDDRRHRTLAQSDQKGSVQTRQASRQIQNRSRDLECGACCVIQGDFQAPNWLDLQRLHHNRRKELRSPNGAAIGSNRLGASDAWSTIAPLKQQRNLAVRRRYDLDRLKSLI